MTTTHSIARALAASLLVAAAAFATQQQRGGADPSDDATKLGSPPALPEGMTEEQMWPAATAEGWKKPCLVHWQRSFADALTVARERNKPIMVAVNMDGEIASEHFAGVRYRDPATAEMMSHYECVIASVYRHTPRDYDTDGKRVPCPRFGTVTCGEHIQAERELYEKYFDGRRISPRHIVLDLEEKETLDVFYSWDVQTVTNTFVKGVEGWPEPNPDREPTLENLATSADVADREMLEKQYVVGTREERKKILTQLIEPRALDQVEVLRAAIFGFDIELARLARRALATCETEGALDLMAEVLKQPIGVDDRNMLLDAVRRMAETSPRAKTLLALHSGLALESRHIAVVPPADATAAYESARRTAPSVSARADAVETRPQDPEALIALAEAMLDRAMTTTGRFGDLFAEDARDSFTKAKELGAADGPRRKALEAAFAWRGGDTMRAREHAVDAVQDGYLRLATEEAEAEGDVAAPALRERVLRLFADARRARIRRAYRSGEEWDPEWLSDVNAAYTLLWNAGRIDDASLVEFYDFLMWIGATPRAVEVLETALEQYPDSALLHERLRSKLLWDGGPEALELAYAERLANLNVAGSGGEHQRWFAAYASLVAAEQYRRLGRFDEALESYRRGTTLFAEHASAMPSARDSSDHFIALAHAGRARLLMERGKRQPAALALLKSFHQREQSAASADGLGITPVATAKMLKARCEEAGEQAIADSVQAALDALDPKLLEPPPSELPGAGRRGRRRR